MDKSTIANQEKEGTKTKCNECKYKHICKLQECKQLFKACFLTDVSEKLKVKPENVLKTTDKIWKITGVDLISMLKHSIHAEDWQRMTEKRKRIETYDMLVWYLLRHKRCCGSDFTTDDITKTVINVFIAFANFYYGAWRDGEYVYCIGCGKLIPNNKSHNIKYCENCKGYHEDAYYIKTRICADCGEKFDVDIGDTRSYRCFDCQIKANRENNRKRVAKYRQKKLCND